MTFHPEQVDRFLDIFDTSKLAIRQFPGCCGLKLLRNLQKENQLFTYSLWDTEDSLNAYRHSDLFESTWAKTKVLFSEKPLAFSTEVIRDLNSI
jgi:heme-degrading monooxygenase HmoA